jgi:hypothetical protein
MADQAASKQLEVRSSIFKLVDKKSGGPSRHVFHACWDVHAAHSLVD